MPQLQAAAMDATKATPVAQGFTKYGFLGLLGLAWKQPLLIGARNMHTDVHRENFPAILATAAQLQLSAFCVHAWESSHSIAVLTCE